MKIVIIDDDPISIAQLEYHLTKLDDLDVVKTSLDPELGKTYVLEENIDAVFLDIHFKGVTGLKIAEEIHQYKPEVIIVLVSSYDKYAVDAFELNIIDYILKPVELNRLDTTINRIKKQLKHQIKALHIQLFNRLELIVANEYIPLTWRTAKAQELFLYLLQHNGRSLSKEELMDILWPEGKESYSILYTTVHHVRAILENYKDYIQIVNNEAGYQIVLRNVEIDLVEWEKAILNLPDVSSKSIDDYEQVVKKNTGVYLDGHGYLWAEPEKLRLEALWITVATEIATYYKHHNLYEAAIRWYLMIAERNKAEEQVYFSLMKLFDKQGKSDLVRRYYERLVVILDEELDVEPSDYITTWYQEWK